MRRRQFAVVALAAVLAGCSPSGSEVTVAKTIAETPITIPKGVLAAMPFQNRLDVAKEIFQIKLINGTPDAVDVIAVQFVWDGLTTAIAYRENSILAGDRIDFPVPLAPANCWGDGTQGSMPDLASAVAAVTLRGGQVLEVPVFDVEHFARNLYLKDCERQHIIRAVDIQFADIHEVTVDGRPVTEGVLRLTRRQSLDTIAVTFISNTIIFTFVSLGASQNPVATLRSDQSIVEVPVRFIEGRCDAHALSESSQPFNFYAVVQLGDGIERTFRTVPAVADQNPMRRTVESGCKILAKSGIAGG